MKKSTKLADGLYFQVRGLSGDHRFVRLFKETWEKIPSCYQQVMLAHWKQGWGEDGPEISIRDWTSDENPDDQTILGGVGLNGGMISFWAGTADIMPDDVVKSLVAHELGHVYQCAICFREGLPEDKERRTQLEEEDADQRATRWKFSPDQRKEWKATYDKSRQDERDRHALGSLSERINAREFL